MAFAMGARKIVPLLMLLSSLALAACSSTNAALSIGQLVPDGAIRKQAEADGRYGALNDEKFPVRAVNLSRIDERYLRQFVDFKTGEHPGTIVIDTENRFLYLVQDEGKAIRYGIGVGVAGLEFTGDAVVGFKRQWPRWTPTADMIRRNPELYKQWRGGMEPGPANPLGARALYLVKDGKDTLYRIHGTTEPHTIGKAVSSGCIRMLNHDVIDLYRRVPAGVKVVVLGGRVATAGAAPPDVPEMAGAGDSSVDQERSSSVRLQPTGVPDQNQSADIKTMPGVSRRAGIGCACERSMSGRRNSSGRAAT